MNGEETFCLCWKCDAPIYVGDNCVSVTASYDLVESAVVVQPLQAESLALYCMFCAPRRLNRFILIPLNLDNDEDD